MCYSLSRFPRPATRGKNCCNITQYAANFFLSLFEIKYGKTKRHSRSAHIIRNALLRYLTPDCALEKKASFSLSVDTGRAEKMFASLSRRSSLQQIELQKRRSRAEIQGRVHDDKNAVCTRLIN